MTLSVYFEENDEGVEEELLFNHEDEIPSEYTNVDSVGLENRVFHL